jgi:hypothetical protein
MKIISKEIKECENTDSTKTIVLDITYSHKGEKWRLLVKDFEEKNEKKIIKQLRKKVQEYFLTKKQWQ